MDQPPNQNKPNGQKGSNKSEGNIVKFLIVSLIITFCLNMLITGINGNNSNNIRYDEFITMIDNGEVESVTFLSDRYQIKPTDEYIDQKLQEQALPVGTDIESQETTETTNDTGDSVDVTSTELETVAGDVDVVGAENTDEASTGNESLDEFLDSSGLFGSIDEDALLESQYDNYYLYTGRIAADLEIVNRLEEAGVEYEAPIVENNAFLDFFVDWVLPLLFIYGMMTLIIAFVAKRMGSGGKGGGIMGVGKSNAKMYLEEKTGVTFEDVAGQEEAKESLAEIVDLLHHPKKYVDIGAKQPKGALLVGPPGTGKTLLAKAVAGEASVPFFSLSGSDFVEMFVGVGASRVRDLFKEAKQHAPCIIFIDEIDAIGKSRDNQIGGNDEREQTLNQLLSEMDGFDSSKGVVILAATNRPEILDKALLRPGRFDRRVIVERPDLAGRLAILQVHIKHIKISPQVNLKEIALSTSGAVGADLANMVNEAALRAVRMGRKQVIQEDLMEAVEVVIAGKEKKDRILNEKERRVVAFHEVGHALASALQKDSKPVQKITIVPRTMGALGYTMQVPEEEKYLMSKQEILDEITVFLAGRCAEVIEFDVETTGASNDIERATQLARNMVGLYGMSEEFGMMALERANGQYLNNQKASIVSDITGAEMDQVVNNLMKNCYDKAMSILRENYEALVKISEYLISKETISGDTFMKLLKNEVVADEVENAETISIFEYIDDEDGNFINEDDEPTNDGPDDTSGPSNNGPDDTSGPSDKSGPSIPEPSEENPEDPNARMIPEPPKDDK